MKIKIYYFGKQSEVSVWEQIYLQRIGHRVEIETVALPQAGLREEIRNKEKEADVLLKKIDSQEFVVVLDEMGKNLDSVSISNTLSQAFETHGNILFIIGGAFGLAPQVLERANLKLSFGKAVWTRNLVRLMLFEQVYRALEIRAGSNFHKL